MWLVIVRGRVECRMRTQWVTAARPSKGLRIHLDALTTQTVKQGIWDLKSNRLEFDNWLSSLLG